MALLGDLTNEALSFKLLDVNWQEVQRSLEGLEFVDGQGLLITRGVPAGLAFKIVPRKLRACLPPRVPFDTRAASLALQHPRSFDIRWDAGGWALHFETIGRVVVPEDNHEEPGEPEEPGDGGPVLDREEVDGAQVEAAPARPGPPHHEENVSAAQSQRSSKRPADDESNSQAKRSRASRIWEEGGSEDVDEEKEVGSVLEIASSARAAGRLFKRSEHTEAFAMEATADAGELSGDLERAFLSRKRDGEWLALVNEAERVWRLMGFNFRNYENIKALILMVADSNPYKPPFSQGGLGFFLSPRHSALDTDPQVVSWVRAALASLPLIKIFGDKTGTSSLADMHMRLVARAVEASGVQLIQIDVDWAEIAAVGLSFSKANPFVGQKGKRTFLSLFLSEKESREISAAGVAAGALRVLEAAPKLLRRALTAEFSESNARNGLIAIGGVMFRALRVLMAASSCSEAVSSHQLSSSFLWTARALISSSRVPTSWPTFHLTRELSPTEPKLPHRQKGSSGTQKQRGDTRQRE